MKYKGEEDEEKLHPGTLRFVHGVTVSLAIRRRHMGGHDVIVDIIPGNDGEAEFLQEDAQGHHTRVVVLLDGYDQPCPGPTWLRRAAQGILE